MIHGLRTGLHIPLTRPQGIEIQKSELEIAIGRQSRPGFFQGSNVAMADDKYTGITQ